LIEQNKDELARLLDLMTSIKNIGSGSGNSGQTGASSSDLMMMRSRMEYVEKECTNLKKMFTDLKK